MACDHAVHEFAVDKIILYGHRAREQKSASGSENNHRQKEEEYENLSSA